MDKFLEELKAQRDQIQAHLDWLDLKIKDLEGTSSTAPAPVSLHAPTPANNAIIEETDEVEFVPSAYGSSTGSEIKKLKIGCSIIFILASGLFIFFLFGLPELMQTSESTEEPETIVLPQTTEPELEAVIPMKEAPTAEVEAINEKVY